MSLRLPGNPKVLELPGNPKVLPNTLGNPKVLELPGGTTLESLYQINDQSIWFLIWILKKMRFWSDLIKETLEAPFEVERDYYTSGQIIYFNLLKNNKLHGIDRTWHPNRQIWLEYHWKDGKKDGMIRKWYDNGQLFEETLWKNSCKYGWNIIGKMDKESFFFKKK